MIKIDLLRTQHDCALAMAELLRVLVEHYDRRTSAVPILMQLNRLVGLLRVHLAQEHVEIYPALMASPDAEVVRSALRNADEMGGLAIDIECFARQWSCSDAIAANIDEFSEAAHRLLLALEVRIERANLYLYPLVEAEARRRSVRRFRRASPAPLRLRRQAPG